jgi:hypothetical protein
MQDLVMLGDEWKSVYERLGGLSTPGCIIELDWSDNQLPGTCHTHGFASR